MLALQSLRLLQSALMLALPHRHGQHLPLPRLLRLMSRRQGWKAVPRTHRERANSLKRKWLLQTKLLQEKDSICQTGMLMKRS